MIWFAIVECHDTTQNKNRGKPKNLLRQNTWMVLAMATTMMTMKCSAGDDDDEDNGNGDEDGDER